MTSWDVAVGHVCTENNAAGPISETLRVVNSKKQLDWLLMLK
jgi:hypothetical protein